MKPSRMVALTDNVCAPLAKSVVGMLKLYGDW